ncbi:MAG: DUF4450 domain-containing protein [Chitinophagaceae bacterium]|nr:DUF4450 domain-containing protein [Chitinophagaceae bacterium]
MKTTRIKCINIKKLSFLLMFYSIFSNPILSTGQINGLHKSKYDAIDGAVVGYNIGHYNNRPLYINNADAFILTGDQPIARLAKEQYLYGTFMLAIERNGKVKWLQECDQITSIYTPGKMAWQIADKEFTGLKVSLEILPMANYIGMSIRAMAVGTIDGDKLIWAFGGAKWFNGQNLSSTFDAMVHPELIIYGFKPEECKNNVIDTTGQINFVSLTDSTTNQKKLFCVAGSCNYATKLSVSEASAYSNMSLFKQSKAKDLPILNGTVALEEGKPIYWAFESFNEAGNPDLSKINSPENAFSEGIKRTEYFQNRLKINTPDPYLNAIAQASVAAVDGTWYPPVFVHGAMQYNVRFPGWRTIFGGSMYGWHERVKDEAKFYIDAQIKESDKTEAKADPALLLTGQHSDSRFYGAGRISIDQIFYDMQTQFFDQIIEEWRFSADLELEKILRPALELHLIWMRDCFDPDDDGVYTSYLNTWPTDSQWYNGGGTAEETSYAYRGHLAALDMARRAGDKKAENYHTQMLDKIKESFFKKLWIKDKGHSGAYLEEGGHKRLHKDPWLYSIFLPIDAGLTSKQQALESVYYSEWALQNDRMPAGGRRVWTSNWMPGRFSVRELWPGDNYHLALSYFLAGLPNDGWDIMRGTFMTSAFNHQSPGNLGGVQGGVDFGDCVHTFARTLVAGLFGYKPDYPNGKVNISPQFPTYWNNASIELPDVKIAFNRNGNRSIYSFELARAANLELLLPVHCNGIENVRVNGEKVKWELLPGVGCSIVKIDMLEMVKAEVTIEMKKTIPCYAPEFLEGNVGEVIRLKAKDAQIIGYEDPQGVLENTETQNGIITATLTKNKGFHTVVSQVMVDKTPQWRVFRIKVNDPAGESNQQAKFIRKIPENAAWNNIDISSKFNANVTRIYYQLYLTPRPNTVSARLGSDGYSPWTHLYWNIVPPAINTDNVKSMLDNQNRLITPQKIPFLWNPVYGFRNIAFTSLWDNYSSKIDFPVNKTGNAIFFLIAGSTNWMQCQIANAVIRLNYSDGQTDSLELIPPLNFWNLCPIGGCDYTSEKDKFCLPNELPQRVQLGENCRAMLLNLKMRKGIELQSLTLETLSQEVVVGLMGITILNQ